MRWRTRVFNGLPMIPKDVIEIIWSYIAPVQKGTLVVQTQRDQVQIKFLEIVGVSESQGKVSISITFETLHRF